LKIKRKFYLVNWLTRLLFQLDAPGDDDNMVAAVEGEPLNVEETAKGQTHVGSPQDDAEVDANGERAEV
jgi:hypothetical protein